MPIAVSRAVHSGWVTCSLLFLLVPTVFAQSGPNEDGPNELAAAAESSAAELSTVVVTGTHILQSSAGQAQPVQSISAEQILQSGFTDVSSVLQSIPQAGA